MSGPAGTTERSLVAVGSTWEYHDQGVDLGDGWRQATGEWPAGAAPLGYGESYVRTNISYGDDPSDKHPTAYFRIDFLVEDPSAVEKLYLRSMFDDGFVFYLNGREGGRAWMPGGEITFATRSSGHETGNNYMTFDVSAQIPNLVAGHNSLAVEVHQFTAYSSDMTMDFGLTAFVQETASDDGPPFESTAGGVPSDSVWKFWDRGDDLPADWNEVEFDDSAWSTGRAPLGFGEPYIEGQTSPGPITTYFRHSFTSARRASDLVLTLDYDDGAIVYVNGVEVYRTSSMPDGPVDSSTFSDWHEAGHAFEVFRSEYAHLIGEGPNVIAVEVHQSSTTSSDLVWDGAISVEDGTDWYAVAAPGHDATPGWDFELQDVALLGGQRGLAVGYWGKILLTTDGGETWSDNSLSDQLSLTQLDVVDLPDGREWIVVPSRGDAQLISSRDGGQSWAEITTPGEVNQGVALLDPQIGVVAARFPPLGEPELFWTRNGGASWEGMTASAGVDHVQALGRVDARTALIASEEGLYLAELDSALEWTTRQVLDLSDSRYYFQSARAIAVQDTPLGPNLWVCGRNDDHALMLISRDGGESWTDVSPVMEEPLWDCSFGQDGLGVAVTQGNVLLRTEDYGRTWNRLRSRVFVGVSVRGTNAVAVSGEHIVRSRCEDCVLDAEAPTGLAPDCATTSPVPAWTGVAVREPDNDRGAALGATVTWSLVSSTGCVDEYQPSGTAESFTVGKAYACNGALVPNEHPIEPSDGYLRVDRSAQPWTYEIAASSPWYREYVCDSGVEDTLDDGDWIEGTGTSLGLYIRGLLGTWAEGVPCDAGSGCTYVWSFTAEL